MTVQKQQQQQQQQQQEGKEEGEVTTPEQRKTTTEFETVRMLSDLGVIKKDDDEEDWKEKQEEKNKTTNGSTVPPVPVKVIQAQNKILESDKRIKEEIKATGFVTTTPPPPPTTTTKVSQEEKEEEETKKTNDKAQNIPVQVMQAQNEILLVGSNKRIKEYIKGTGDASDLPTKKVSDEGSLTTAAAATAAAASPNLAQSNDTASMDMAMPIPTTLQRATVIRQPASQPGAIPVEPSNHSETGAGDNEIHGDSIDSAVGGGGGGGGQQGGNNSPLDPPPGDEENLIEAELVRSDYFRVREQEQQQQVDQQEVVVATAAPTFWDRKWIYLIIAALVVVALVAISFVLVTALQDNNNSINDGSSSSSNNTTFWNSSTEEETGNVDDTTANPFPNSLQFGNTIIGSAPGDRFGAPLALNANGTILAIGSRQATTVGEDSGLVSVYRVSGGAAAAEAQWDRLGNVLWGEAPGDEFAHSGMAMSAEGRRLAVGATFRDVVVDAATINGTEESVLLVGAGNVRVFELTENDKFWTQVGPSLNGRQEGDEFGRAVAMSADGKIVAGSSYASSENGPNSGNVMVYREVITITETTTKTNEATLEEEPPSSSWELMGSVLLGRAQDDRFGRALDMSADGRRIVVGATQFKKEGGGGAGYVQVYDFNGTGWHQVGQDLWGDEDGDVFGRDVAISNDGSIIACGANLANHNGLEDAGLARIYQYDKTLNKWLQLGGTIVGTAEGDNLGLTIDLSADGSRVAVGASQKKTGVGYVLILDYIPTRQTWIQVRDQLLKGEVEYDLEGELVHQKFGSEVQLTTTSSGGSGDEGSNNTTTTTTVLAVGVIAGGLNGKNSGHVQVFHLPETFLW